MSTERDPQLQALFARAERQFDDDAFTRKLIATINRERRRTVLVWSVIAVIIALVLAVLAAPVFTALSMATQLLPASVVEIETDWLGQLLSPINSVAAIIALGILGIRKFYKRFLG